MSKIHSSGSKINRSKKIHSTGRNKINTSKSIHSTKKISSSSRDKLTSTSVESNYEESSNSTSSNQRRGSSSEKMVADYYSKLGYTVKNVSNKRGKENQHTDLLIRKGKRGKLAKLKLKRFMKPFLMVKSQEMEESKSIRNTLSQISDMW
jgi:hypothetical protein